MKRSTILLLPILSAVLLSMVACHKPKAVTESAWRSEQQVRATKAPESVQQQWAYLNRIRQEDALNSLIDRTFLNDQNELGVVLFSSVTPDQVPAIMRKATTKMAQKFPNEDVILNVYSSATPLRKLGIAHLNGQTKETIYTPEK